MFTMPGDRAGRRPAWSAPRFHAYTPSDQSVTTGSYQNMSRAGFMTGVLYDSHRGYVASNGRYYAPWTGAYEVLAGFTFSAVSGGMTRMTGAIDVNNGTASIVGGGPQALYTPTATVNDGRTALVPTVLLLAAGDFIEYFVFLAAGTSPKLTGGKYTSFFSAAWVGPYPA